VPWIPDLYGAPKMGKEGEIKKKQRNQLFRTSLTRTVWGPQEIIFMVDGGP